jgi:hypothetical protein
MIKINRRAMLKTSAASAAAVSLPAISKAQNTTYEQPGQYTPNDLGGKLTPFGAVKAGNADGSIPAWTGENLPLPAGYQSGDPRPLPFPDEKPVLVITAANLSQHQNKLSNGQLGLFQQHPDYSIQVYPTHRTAIAPQYVYDYINKNATSAQTGDGGNTVSGAYGGIPFPIPKDGNEVMWNHLLSWQGTTAYFVADSHLMPHDGGLVFESRVHVWQQIPYYFENGESRFQGFNVEAFILPVAPPFEAGGAILALQTVNQVTTPQEGWIYLQGQRRTRRAPELEYDTPDTVAGGTENWDEVDIFTGKLVQYDCKYLGIKEMYVPYNSNRINQAAAADQFQPHFVNPDLMRWELHRCRVVEMRLKSGARNVDARRIVYCDEDTGSAIMGEVYDAQDALWKFQHVNPCIYPDFPCVHTFQFFCTYDLHAGNYAVASHFDTQTQPQWKFIPELPASFFTPGELGAKAGGF